MLIFIYLLVNVLLVRVESQGAPDDEAKKTVLEEYIRQYSGAFEHLLIRHIQFHWLYSIDSTTENYKQAKNSSSQLALFKVKGQENANELNKQLNYKKLLNPIQQKMFEKIIHIGPDSLIGIKLKNGQDQYQILQRLTGGLMKILHEVKYKSFTAKDVEKILKDTYNAGRLEKQKDKEKYYFDLLDAWHGSLATIGRELKGNFTEFIDLLAKSANKNGFGTIRDEQIDQYGPGIIESIDRTWAEVKPLYQKLHAVARFKIDQIFGKKLVKPDGAIPAHLLGSLLSHDWLALFNLLKPMDTEPYDQKINLTPLEMAQYAGTYFTNIGFDSIEDFNLENSIFAKPAKNDSIDAEKIKTGSKLQCDASAWDFKNKKDFRITICAEPTRNDMQHMIELFAKVYYFKAFKEQHILLRRAPIPSFEHAIGEAFRLSASRHDIWSQLENENSRLNPLMYTALDKLVFLPFSYTLEKWRWAVYEGKIMPDDYQAEWDKLRLAEMGIQQPVKRDIADFDPGLKQHVLAGQEYIRYYISTILQFQFLAALCPTNKIDCDIQQNENAFRTLYPMMNKGSTQDWRDILYDFTGDRDLNTAPLLEYFKPLENYLDDVIEKNNLFVGWKSWEPPSKHFIDPSGSSTALTIGHWALIAIIPLIFV